MFLKVVVVCSLLVFGSLAQKRGEKCVNRNNDTATCTEIHNCKAAIDALTKYEGSKIYANGTFCTNSQDLVCCQTPEDVKLPAQAKNNSDIDIYFNLTLLMTPIKFPVTQQIINSSESTTASLKEIISKSSSDQLSPEVLLDIFTSPPLHKPMQYDSRLATDNSESNRAKVPIISNLDSEPKVLPLDTNITSVNENTLILLTTPELEKDVTTVSSLLMADSQVLTTDYQNSVKKVLPDRHICGVNNNRSRLAKAPIATIDEYPWLALLKYINKYGNDLGFKCSGALISDQFVITAGHCVQVDKDLLSVDSVRLGEWVFSTTKDCVFDYYGEECSPKPYDIKIAKTTVHPNYNAKNRQNNIALLKLVDKVQYTIFVRPICLPVKDLPKPSLETVLISSGWGSVEQGYTLDIKSKFYVPILPSKECTTTDFAAKVLSEEQICVGKTGFCTADSGGPLMLTENDDHQHWFLEGVMSSGYGCSTENYPGVYTRVTQYIEWILDILVEKTP